RYRGINDNLHSRTRLVAQLANSHASERKPVLLSKCLEPFNCRFALDGVLPLAFRRFQRLQNDILSVLERACFEPLMDERLYFGPGNLDRHVCSPCSLSREIYRRKWHHYFWKVALFLAVQFARS